MDALPALHADRAHEIVRRVAGTRILVVGDVMLDQFTIGRVTRISPEAPVPIVAFERDEFRAGGAANVAVNARSLGAHVELVSLVGADRPAAQLQELLAAADVDGHGFITDDTRRTTTKVRIVTTRNQQVARVDYESDVAPTAAIEDAVIGRLESRVPTVQAIIISDYLKGVITRRLVASVVTLAQEHGIPVLVDPKIPHLDFYTGATLVTPNHHEAEIATHMRIRSDEEARRAARLFRERARCDGVLITRGEHGMWVACDGVEGPLPAAAREVSDVTGAGDTVVAALALAIAAGATATEAAHIANAAAGVVVAKFGPATLTASELLAGFGPPEL